MDLEPLGQLREARLGSLAPRLGDQADDVRLGRSRPSASSVSIASSWRPAALDRALEVGRLGVEDTVELAAQGPRDLARLDFEEGPAGPDPAQERPDRLAVLRGHDASAAAEPPRHGQAELAEAGREDRCLVRADDELEVRPAAGQAQRPAGQEPAAEPGTAAMVGGGTPVERATGSLQPPRAA